jgi:hypothetical protein
MIQARVHVRVGEALNRCRLSSRGLLSPRPAEVHAGNVVRFSSREAEVHASVVPELLTNIAGWLASEDGVRLSMPFYAKVVAHSEQRGRFLVQFTSTPQEFVTYVESLAAR